MKHDENVFHWLTSTLAFYIFNNAFSFSIATFVKNLLLVYVFAKKHYINTFCTAYP